YDVGSGYWVGGRAIGSAQATYVIEAVDNRGNVSWLPYVSSSGSSPVTGPGAVSILAPTGQPASGGDFGLTGLGDVAGPTPGGLWMTTFAPWSGRGGMAVSIIGTKFTGATAVTFNGTSTTYSVNSDFSITAIVPQGATSGPITVTTLDGTASTANAFT